MSDRKQVNDDNIVICTTCNKKYKITFKSVHFPAAGSQADWLNIHLPCKHDSEEVYDDNRRWVEAITEVSE
jgi:hypothetical protein